MLNLVYMLFLVENTLFCNKKRIFQLTNAFSMFGNSLTSFLTVFSFGLNIILVVFFSSFYALLVLKPKDLSENLTKMAYSIPGLKQGKETTRHLEQVISRLAFMGGLFLAFLAFFPLVLGNLLHLGLSGPF